VRVSSPNVIGFVTSQNTPCDETDETLLRGGFVTGFVTYLGTFIGNRFRHQTSVVSSQRFDAPSPPAGEALDHAFGKPAGNSVVDLEAGWK
jgi:hypothetical protein